MVTSTEGMLHGILSYTSNLRPTVTLDTVLVVGTSSLEQGLISTSTSGNDTDLSASGVRDGLLTSTGKTKTGSSLILIVSNDNSEASRSTSKGTTITLSGLDIAHNSSLGNLVEGKAVSNNQICLLSAINELSGVHTFGSNEEFRITLILVRVKELNLSYRSTTTGVMKNLLDHTTNVPMTLGVVKCTKLYGTLAITHVGLKDG